MHAREFELAGFFLSAPGDLMKRPSIDVTAVITALAAALLVRFGVITHVPW